MPKIDVSTEPTQIVDADQTQDRWMIRVSETETKDVFLMDQKAPASEGRGRRLKPGDRAEISLLDRGLWAWTTGGEAILEVEPANFSLNIFSPSVQRVERPRDSSEKVGNYTNFSRTKEVVAGGNNQMFNNSNLAGELITQVSVQVIDWDRNNDGNPIHPNRVSYMLKIAESFSNETARVGQAVTAGAIHFDPMLRVPEGQDVEIWIDNPAGNDLTATASITMVEEV